MSTSGIGAQSSSPSSAGSSSMTVRARLALDSVVAKDRPGNRAKHSTAAMIDIDGTDTVVTYKVHLSDAAAAHAAGERFRPTVLMDRVSRYIETHPGAGAREVRSGVSGKNNVVAQALEVLIEEGWVSATPTGAGKTTEHRSVRPYREGDELTCAVAPVVAQGPHWDEF